MKTAREIIADADVEFMPHVPVNPGPKGADAIIAALATEGFRIVPTADVERLTEKAIVGEYMWTPKELHEAIQETLEAAAKAVTQMGRCYDGLEPWTKPINADKAAAAIRALGATHG